MRHRSWLNVLGLACLLCVFNIAVSAPTSVAAQEGYSCAKSLEPRLLVGGFGRVTSGNSNNVRDAVGTSGQLVGQIPGGDTFEVLDGPICAEGAYWWQVHYSDFAGWTAETQDMNYWLEPYVPSFKSTIKDATIHVVYDNLSFDVSTALAGDVNYHFEIADWGSANPIAEHVCFHLRLDLPGVHRPNNQLCVINTGGMDNEVYALQQILTDRPSVNIPDGQTHIPTPFDYAFQLMQAQLNYIDTDVMQGVSFVTHYALGDDAITGDALEYNFSGLTGDGRYMIFFDYPANTTLLPAGHPTYSELSLVRENPLQYYKNVVDILNAASTEDFTPNLDVLNAVIKSITIN